VAELTKQLDRSRIPARMAYLAILLLATLTSLGPALDSGVTRSRVGDWCGCSRLVRVAPWLPSATRF
jgi:hypothetical protein